MSDPFSIISESVSKEVLEFINGIPSDIAGGVLLFAIVVGLIALALYIGLFILLMKIKKKLISHLEKKRGKTLTLQFLGHVITVALIVYFIVLPMGGKEIASSLLGSTAVAAAIVGFAAQDAIKDMFAGLLISVYKPFDVGSRIEFEDGTAGVVESMTLRHIVLILLDTTRAVIPNSKANAMKVINYSFGDVPRSVVFKFPISYDADVEKAKKVIRDTICANPLTLNEDKYDEKEPNSRSVYFLELQNSSLIMGATVRFPANVRSEVLKDEINTSVFKALKENGIEIPYDHLDVIMHS